MQRFLARPLGSLLTAYARVRYRLRGSSLARRVAIRRVSTIALAAVVAATVHSTLGEAESVTASWGETVPVVMTTKPVAAGETLTASAVKVVEVPRALAPGRALAEPPVGRRTRIPLDRGEILTAAKVAEASAGTIASRLAPGTQAVTVPIRDSPAPLAVGDLVDVYGVVPDRSGEVVTSARTRVVSHDAVVLARDDSTATLAVATAEVSATVEAASGGDLRIVITG